LRYEDEINRKVGDNKRNIVPSFAVFSLYAFCKKQKKMMREREASRGERM